MPQLPEPAWYPLKISWLVRKTSVAKSNKNESHIPSPTWAFDSFRILLTRVDFCWHSRWLLLTRADPCWLSLIIVDYRCSLNICFNYLFLRAIRRCENSEGEKEVGKNEWEYLPDEICSTWTPYVIGLNFSVCSKTSIDVVSVHCVSQYWVQKISRGEKTEAWGCTFRLEMRRESVPILVWGLENYQTWQLLEFDLLPISYDRSTPVVIDVNNWGEQKQRNEGDERGWHTLKGTSYGSMRSVTATTLSPHSNHKVHPHASV